MKAKILSAFLLTAFLIVFSIAAVSAITFTPAITSINVAVSNTTVLDPDSATNPVITLEDGQTVTTINSIAGQVVTFTATPDYDYVDMGKVYTGTSNVSNASGNSQLVTITIVKTFCSNGPVNESDTELEVDISSDGDEDLEWVPLDIIEVDVSFDNSKDLDGDGDLQDLVFELGLFDSEGNNVAEDLIWISTDEESSEFGDVDEDDDADYTFEFKVSPDLDEGDYTLMVKAYTDNGEDDEYCLDSSSDLESTYYQEITITKDADDESLIAFDEITVEPSTASCGDSVVITAKSYNLGSEKQEAVKIILYSKDFQVNQNLVIENFDTDDEETVEFTFKIPTNISEAKYTLSLYALHSYDEDDDEDEDDEINFDDESFGEQTDPTKIYMAVSGKCINSTVTNASVTAEFSDETPSAVIGKQVIIEATIKNTGNTATNYTVDVTGNTAWSTLSEIDPKTFTINAGESEKVSIYLDIDSDAEAGEQSFNIKVTHGLTSTNQEVKIELEKGFAWNNIGDHIKDNWVVYLIVLVNIILIVAIIIVVIKMVSA